MSAIPTHTQTRLEQDIQHKQALREQVAQQLEGDMQRFKDMEREAAALISKARHANSKLMVSSPSCSLHCY
jgi:F0F1-type ATP synthase membrane subunit b/b'